MNVLARTAALATLLCAVVGPVSAQTPEDPLPPGPGKDVVMRVCTACHGAEQFAFARYTPGQWDNEISKMQAAGAEMTPEEQTAISAYLGKALAKAEPAAGEATKDPSP